MGAKILVEGAEPNGDNLYWIENAVDFLESLELASAKPTNASVVVVPATYLERIGDHLALDPMDATVIRKGTGAGAWLIGVPTAALSIRKNKDQPQSTAGRELIDAAVHVTVMRRLLKEAHRALDAEMVQGLEKLVDDLGERAEFRLEGPKESTRRYVAAPNNFFSLKIQPRVRNIRVTVFGNVSDFDAKVTKTLNLKADRPSYSRFLIKAPEHFPDALAVMSRASELR